MVLDQLIKFSEQLAIMVILWGIKVKVILGAKSAPNPVCLFHSLLCDAESTDDCFSAIGVKEQCP